MMFYCRRYQFLVPEYMAHEKHQPSDEDYERARRAPYAHDILSAYQREGGAHLTDKTVKLPEVKRHGYGVRSGKPQRTRSGPAPDRARPSKTAQQSQLEAEKPHLRYLPL